MADEPHRDPSPLHASILQNPPPFSSASTTHILHYRFSAPPEVLRQDLHHSPAAQEYASADFRSSRLVNSSFQQVTGDDQLQESEDGERHSEEAPREEQVGKKDGGSFEQNRGGRVKHPQPHAYAEALPFAMCMQENPRDTILCVRQPLESPRGSVGEGGTEAYVDEGEVEASVSERSRCSSGRSLQGESDYTNQGSQGSSSERDMINHLSLHDDEKGQVSPLRALSHIAHMKRKQDCLQSDVAQMQPHGTNGIVHESSSKRKKLKQVQFQLEPLAYQKLMRILVEQHQGSVERFIMATLDSISMQDNSARRAATTPRKPAYSKWKRARFDQLKGTETEELALAFRSLADCTPNVEVTSDLMHVPWQELNMLQVQTMLEETKKMLLINEKVHYCPFTQCDRRFSTPGNLKDHLNEHSGEQPYSCSFEDCSHRFRSKQHLCRHMKKHERAHTCTFEGCNKRFAFRERLIVHQKIHSDERPLSCPWEGCGKTFKWANSLHGHMRTHTGEKPFQCTFVGCGRLFGYKVDLTRHRRTHFGQPARANH